MATLKREIQNLHDAYMRKLAELHDDFVHTRMLWNHLRARVQHFNENPIVRNATTGSVTAGVDLAAKAVGSLDRLRERTFKDIVAQFELFTDELLRQWLMGKPTLLSEKTLNIATLLKCSSLGEAQAAAIREAVESTISGLMYGRPDKWFNCLRKNLALRSDAKDEASFIEMKARRDILEHNHGIVEATYREKAKSAAKFNVGDRLQVF
ncbi:MAG TPA: hypothetical protein VFC46_01960, partial [Humisphaera sp.]|nr:hypothetical protein [Humisphaera sp.]